MQKKHIHYQVNLSQPVVLLLEATEDRWSKVYNIANGLIQSLPGRLNKIYFVGNKEAYPIRIPADFRENSPVWFSKNKDRVMLISPIFESLQSEGFLGMIVIICSKIPVDTMDYQDSEIFERAIFVNVGNEPLGEDYNELSNPDIIQITDALNNPIEALYITSSDFLPLRFESDYARIEAMYDESKFYLRICPQHDSFKPHIIALCKDIPPIKIIRKRGRLQNLLGREEHAWFSLPSLQELPEELKPVVSAMKNKQKFTCPQCKNIHPYNTLICPEGDIILKDLPLDTLILFKKERFLPISDWFAYPLSDKKAITNDARLYEYNGTNWKFIKQIEPFEEVGDETWSIFHRV